MVAVNQDFFNGAVTGYLRFKTFNTVDNEGHRDPIIVLGPLEAASAGLTDAYGLDFNPVAEDEPLPSARTFAHDTSARGEAPLGHDVDGGLIFSPGQQEARARFNARHLVQPVFMPAQIPSQPVNLSSQFAAAASLPAQPCYAAAPPPGMPPYAAMACNQMPDNARESMYSLQPRPLGDNQQPQCM